MDAKLNHSDLSALLAKGAGMSLAKAELLTKTVFDLIIEGLEQDGVVKINGLGTFKLTDVASRSSVNVNTGEKFEIKGHKKLVFTPADTLKECVNQPFAMFEPVEVDETYSDDAEEDNNDLAAEENNPIEDVQGAVNEVLAEAEDTAVEEAVAEETVVTEVVEAEKEEEKHEVQPTVQAEEVAEQPVEVQPRRPEPVMVHVPKKEKKPFAVPEQKSKKSYKWLYIVLSLLVLCAAIPILWLTPIKHVEVVVNETVIGDAKQKTDAVTTATVVDATTSATPLDKELVSTEVSIDAIVAETIEPAEYKFVITKELEALDLKNITVADTTLYDMADVWAEHKVVAHETLTRIALKYYGDKKLWPYIVKYNSLARPDDLRKGMKVLIPKLNPRS